jgi:hypothetical protein
VIEPEALPELSFVVPAANENRWSDLLATLIGTDPGPLGQLLGVSVDEVRREEVVPGLTGRHTDRLDLLLLHQGRQTAAIEVKLLSDLGPQQLTRYEAAFPDAGQYRVLHLAGLPVNLREAPAWTSLTWEHVLEAYAHSSNPWVATTARAWHRQLGGLVPVVDATTRWNDVPDDPAGFELALRARIVWLSRQMDTWCEVEHDIVPSSGGGNWATRMWVNASSAEHYATAELQEGLTAYEWRPDPDRPYRDRVPGPVVLLGLRQEGAPTSEGFDWTLLHQMFSRHVLDENGVPSDGRAWQTTTARPADPVDKANWQAMVTDGAPAWLGKGWGMKVARTTSSCLFGARFGLPPDSTLADVDAELRHVQELLQRLESR